MVNASGIIKLCNIQMIVLLINLINTDGYELKNTELFQNY